MSDSDWITLEEYLKSLLAANMPNRAETIASLTAVYGDKVSQMVQKLLAKEGEPPIPPKPKTPFDEGFES